MRIMIACMFLTMALQAQVDRWSGIKSSGGFEYLPSAGLPESGTLWSSVPKGSNSCVLTLTRRVNGRTTRYAKTLAAHRIATIVYCGKRNFLVGGVRYASWNPKVREGYLARVRFQAGKSPGLVIDEEIKTNLQPARIVMAPGELYVLDAATKRLQVAGYKGWDKLPSDLAFKKIADDHSCRILADPFAVRMSALPTGLVGVSIFRGSSTGVSYFKIYRSGASWEVEDVLGSARPGAPSWKVPAALSLGHQAAFQARLSGASKGPWQLVDAGTGAVVESGMLAGSTTNIPSSPVFWQCPGRGYYLRSAGSGSNLLHPILRYGTGTRADGVALGGGLVSINHFQVGDPMCRVATELEIDKKVSLPIALSIYLSVAIRKLDAARDPVDLDSTEPILIADEVFDLSRAVSKRIRGMGSKVAIPTEPALAGSVVLWQYTVITPSGSIAMSQVFGTTIWDAKLALVAADPSAALAAARHSAKARLQAFARWCDSMEGPRKKRMDLAQRAGFLEKVRAAFRKR